MLLGRFGVRTLRGGSDVRQLTNHMCQRYMDRQAAANCTTNAFNLDKHLLHEVLETIGICPRIDC